MPKIADTHLLGARAVQAVQSILLRSSALSEVIKNDYGEDLIVQTHHEGEADPFQILVQIKGSGVIKFKDDSFSIRFDIGHLYRWVAQSGAVIVCVFDDFSGRVFAFSPRERFSLWDILSTRKKTLPVKLTARDEFTPANAGDIIWKVRIDHFSNLIAVAESRSGYLINHEDVDDVVSELNREITILGLIFLKMIKAVKGDDFSENFRNIINRGAPHFKNNFDNEDLSLREIVMFALVAEVDAISNCGVPPNILEQVTEAAGYFYKAFHPKDWADAELHMRNVWKPYQGIFEKL